MANFGDALLNHSAGASHVVRSERFMLRAKKAFIVLGLTTPKADQRRRVAVGRITLRACPDLTIFPLVSAKR